MMNANHVLATHPRQHDEMSGCRADRKATIRRSRLEKLGVANLDGSGRGKIKDTQLGAKWSTCQDFPVSGSESNQRKAPKRRRRITDNGTE